MWYIYKYTSPSGKIYVGITDCKERRANDHKQKENGRKSDKTKFAYAIRRYGFSNFKYEIIDTADNIEDANKKEMFYIKELDSRNNGYNITAGGDHTGHPVKLNDEQAIAIRKDLEENELTYSNISQKYDIAISMVNKFAKGEAWSHLVGNSPVKRNHLFEKGEDNSQAKLSDKEVIEIRKKLKQNVPRRELMMEYDVSKTLIQMIATGKAWPHLMGEYKYEKKETNGNAKLNVETVAKIKRDLLNGMTKKATSEKYGISKSTVEQIKYEKTWKEVKAEE